MEAERPAHVLVVAHKTAATPGLLEAVRRRAERGPARFHLLVPDPRHAHWRPSELSHPDVTEGEQVVALALPLIEEALHDGEFDEIILSTLPRAVSMWLHIDLPRRVEHLGLPVTTVIAHDPAPAPVD